MSRRAGSLVIVGSVAILARLLSGQHDVSSQRYLSRVAAETNKDLPMMVDEYTEWYSAVGEERLLSMNHRIVDLTADELNRAYMDVAWEEARSLIVSRACSNDGYLPLLDEDVTVRFNFVDKYYEEVESFEVTKADFL